MAGTTTNYALDYPTSTDLVRNGATAIQTLATDIDTLLASSAPTGFLELGAEDTVAPGTPSTTSSTTFVTVAGNSANSNTFTLGPSGVAIVILNVNAQHSLSTGWVAAGLEFSGGYTESISQARSIVVSGTVQQSATRTYLIRGTANSSVTATLAWRVSAATGTLNSSVIQTLTIG